MGSSRSNVFVTEKIIIRSSLPMTGPGYPAALFGPSRERLVHLLCKRCAKIPKQTSTSKPSPTKACEQRSVSGTKLRPLQRTEGFCFFECVRGRAIAQDLTQCLLSPKPIVTMHASRRQASPLYCDRPRGCHRAPTPSPPAIGQHDQSGFH